MFSPITKMRRGEKNMSKQGDDNQTIIEDLPVDGAQQDEVKGGKGIVSSYAGALVVDPSNPNL